VISVVTVCVCVMGCLGRARQGVGRFEVRGGALHLCRSLQFCVGILWKYVHIWHQSVFVCLKMISVPDKLYGAQCNSVRND